MTAELVGTGGSLMIGSSRQKVKTKELPIGWKDLSPKLAGKQIHRLGQTSKDLGFNFCFHQQAQDFQTLWKEQGKRIVLPTHNWLF